MNTNAAVGEKLHAGHDRAWPLGASALFLAWAAPSHTRRSELMARQLGIPLKRIRVLRKRSWLVPLRYALQGLLTLTTLFRERPRVIFVQNPPIFASLFAWLYCALTRSHLIIDSHTDALHSDVWRWSLPLHRFLSRRALTTLVTNAHLQHVVVAWRARSDIVVDVPSDLPPGKPYPIDRPFNVAMVSSYAPDEPFEAVIEMARSLPDVGFFVTGDPAWRAEPIPTDLPSNLCLTGLLPDDEYYGLLRSVDAVMALTTEDHTMQRGACEAVWLGQPIITSHWPVLREAFHTGAVHVDNTAEGIRAGVLRMREARQQFAQGVLRLQQERRKKWQDIAVQLADLITSSSNRRRAPSR